MIIIQVNGGATPNPGMRAIGIVVIENGKVIEQISKNMGIGTCNDAEYLALIEGLKIAIDLRFTDADIIFQSDSKLVVYQVNEWWEVGKDSLKSLNAESRELLSKFQSARVEWVSKKRIFKATAIKDLGYMEPPASCA